MRTVGVIDFNETALADVTTKFKGWIEKLYVDATGQQVHKGEPLFEIYSPELYSAQNEYLLALSHGRPGRTSKHSALTKLKFFDISDEQIAELERTRTGQEDAAHQRAADGIVVEKMVVEGQMVEAGMKLYRLADLGLVWVQAQIYEQDLAFCKLGQEATVSLSYLPDRKFRGRVTYIYPTVDEKTRTAHVRMEFHNPGFFLKPGMFATVEVRRGTGAFGVAGAGHGGACAAARRTRSLSRSTAASSSRAPSRSGPRAENNMYQVLSGLKEGERVVTSGQFMLDSESQLREAIQKMLEPATREALTGTRTIRCPSARQEPADTPCPCHRGRKDWSLHLPDARARLDRIRSSR